MATREIAGKTVQVNDEGFRPANEWDKDIAVAIAKMKASPNYARTLEDHRFCRQVRSLGKAPTLRQIARIGVSTKDLCPVPQAQPRWRAYQASASRKAGLDAVTTESHKQ
jgi:hypothetical protein